MHKIDRYVNIDNFLVFIKKHRLSPLNHQVRGNRQDLQMTLIYAAVILVIRWIHNLGKTPVAQEIKSRFLAANGCLVLSMLIGRLGGWRPLMDQILLDF